MGTATVGRGQIDAAHEAAGTSLDPDAPGAEGTGEDALFDQEPFKVEIGGHSATKETFKLYGGAVHCEPPEGGWKKGSSYELRVMVQCHKDGHTDEIDRKTWDVTDTRRDYGGVIRSMAVVPSGVDKPIAA